MIRDPVGVISVIMESMMAVRTLSDIALLRRFYEMMMMMMMIRIMNEY